MPVQEEENRWGPFLETGYTFIYERKRMRIFVLPVSL